MTSVSRNEVFARIQYGGSKMPNDERILETMPTGTLGLIATESCSELAEQVDYYLKGWRSNREHQHRDESAFKDYYNRKKKVYSFNTNILDSSGIKIK